MRFLKEFWIGMKAYWEAFQFIRAHKMSWLMIIPALLMLGIYYVGSILQVHVFSKEVHNMNDIVWYLIRLFIEISLAILLMNFSKYLVVALLSPLLAYVSLKTERILTGNSYQFDVDQLLKDIKRAIQLVTRNFMWYYFFFVSVLFISFLFTDNPTNSPIFFIVYLIGFYYYGFSFIDYVNERRKLNVAQSVLFVRKHRGLAIAIGLCYSLLILMPVDLSALFGWNNFLESPLGFLGEFFVHLFLWICASFAPILASVASTIAMHKIVNLKK